MKQTMHLHITQFSIILLEWFTLSRFHYICGINDDHHILEVVMPATGVAPHSKRVTAIGLELPSHINVVSTFIS